MSEPAPIQLFVPTYRIDECLAEIRKCLDIGWTGLGFKTVEFEDAWKVYTNLPHAHFLNSATAGLHLAVKIFKETQNWADGDEVITTPITFVSTNHAIAYERLRPVFADVDDFGCLDPESVEQKITGRTRAMLFVGLGGNIGQYAKISELCRSRNLVLIVDAAHLTGTRFEQKTACADADVLIYSFQAVKNLPTSDAGMICFKDEQLDAIVRQQSWLGIDKDTYTRTMSGGTYKWYYSVPHLGYKYHGNSLAAAIALVQLKYVDQDNAYRRQIADWYDGCLKGNNDITPVPVIKGCESSRHLYQVLTKERDEVLLAMNRAGIFPGVHYRDNTEYPMYDYARGTCPNAHRFSATVLSLPLHLRMTKGDVERVAGALLAAAGAR
jgi:dTDP-4-amino-4,6-dideoxygalactose transaminase